MSTIAYPMLVLVRTGSPVMAGWAAFAATAPSILAYIPAGWLMDHREPRRAMLATEFGRVAAVSVVVITLLFGRAAVWLLISMAFVEETLEVFTMLGERRLFRGLVGREETSSVLGRSEARTHMVVLAGRPLGGFLFGLDFIFPFCFDAISFIFSLGALIRIKRKRDSPAPGDQQVKGSAYSVRDILEGVRWVSSTPFAFRPGRNTA